MGISFHAVVVFGLGKNLLFKSILGRCVICTDFAHFDHAHAGHKLASFTLSNPRTFLGMDGTLDFDHFHLDRN